MRLKAIHAAAISLALLGVLSSAACRTRSSVPERKISSVLLIVVDTLPAKTLGCYGNQRDTSPIIDGLAIQGLRYQRVYAPSNWTVPSTASFLSSMYPSEHGAGMRGKVRHLTGKNPPHRLDPSIETLAEILSKKGIQTGLFSANPYLQAGLAQGYETSFIRRVPARELSSRAIRWLDGIGKGAFFAHLQYMDLHIPVEAPEEYVSLFADPSDNMQDPRLRYWSFQKGSNASGPAFESYRRRRIIQNDAAMRYIDTEIGRLLSHLKESGRLSDTLVILTSDHGEEFWQHAAEEFKLGGDPRGIYGVGHGHAMYEEVVRVPLIFMGPGVRSGALCMKTRSLLDLAPTVLGMLGFEVPLSMRGHSLRTELISGDDFNADEDLLIQSPAYGPDSTAIVSGNWKLITRSDGIQLLFNLSQDPGEKSDLFAAAPERANKILKELGVILGSLRPAPGSKQLVADERTTEELRALGYVE